MVARESKGRPENDVKPPIEELLFGPSPEVLAGPVDLVIQRRMERRKGEKTVFDRAVDLGDTEALSLTQFKVLREMLDKAGTVGQVAGKLEISPREVITEYKTSLDTLKKEQL